MCRLKQHVSVSVSVVKAMLLQELEGTGTHKSATTYPGENPA